MGLIERVLSVLFGNGNIVRETAEVFRENAEAAATRAADHDGAVLDQYGAEFAREPRGRFDRFVDGLNRLPRPMMALGVLALIASSMAAPVWFGERMLGLSLVPEPLWWFLGVVVSFYFGGRHQIKSQEFQKSLASTMARVPGVVDGIGALRKLHHATPGVADTGPDAGLTISAVKPTDNAALDDWRNGAQSNG